MLFAGSKKGRYRRSVKPAGAVSAIYKENELYSSDI